MALTESKIIDQITVTENGTILVRETTKVFRDDVEIAKSYHRWSFVPGSDVSEMPQNVQDIAATVWTPEVIAAYQTSLSSANTINS